jgi:hypothetical protein
MESKHRRVQRAARLIVGGGIVFCALGAIVVLYQTISAGRPSLAAWSFSDTDDLDTQLDELTRYVEFAERPRRLIQVDLATHPKVSQFTDIDASPSGFGTNACGLVAAAVAMGGEGWVPLVGDIARAAGSTYGPHSGIQPSNYRDALEKVFGAQRVRAIDRGSLGDLYRELESGRIVIVDIKVNDSRKVPSAEPPNYAHFARMLGIDLDTREIFIENTLGGSPYWTVSMTDFVNAWQLPETSSSIILDPGDLEDVTRWAAILDPPQSVR